MQVVIGILGLTLSPLPFRLRLEDVRKSDVQTPVGLVYAGISYSAMARVNALCNVTSSGKILLAASLETDVVGPTAMQSLESFKSYFPRGFVLRDALHVFSSDEQSFQCFITGMLERDAIAARIEHTNIWILISDFVGTVTVNELHCNLSREEFREIQGGFVSMLFDD